MIFKFLVFFILFNVLFASPTTPSGSRDSKNTKPSTSSQEKPLDLSIKNRYNYGNTPSTSGARKEMLDCSQCDKSFSSRSGLHYHLNYVHKGKTETCEKCRQIFGSRSMLKYHEQTYHTEAKNICDKCNRKFSTKQNLADHHRAEHEENSRLYACEKCPFKTKHRGSFYGHKSAYNH